jgi:hypothetical protein
MFTETMNSSINVLISFVPDSILYVDFYTKVAIGVVFVFQVFVKISFESLVLIHSSITVALISNIFFSRKRKKEKK